MSSRHKPFRRILIINNFGLGDVLFTTPMIRSIKEHVPDAFIGYICNKRALPVLESNPRVDKIHTYERDDQRRTFKESWLRGIADYLRFLREIRAEKYDAVFDLSLNSYMNALTVLAGIPRRIGFRYKRRSLFLTDKFRLKGYERKHVVEYYLDLLDLAGIPRDIQRQPEVYLKEHDRLWAGRFLKELQFGHDEMIIGIIPGGGASWGAEARYKRWMPERYAVLADKVVEKFAAKVILLGGADEREIGQKMAGAMRHPAVNLIGRTTLGQYLALLARCRLAVVNDGGPLHMAVSVGTRVVALMASVDEKVYGPYPPGRHRVVTADVACRPCYRRFRRAVCGHVSCLNDISVEKVFAEVEKALDDVLPLA